MKLIEETRPDIAEVIRLAQEIIRLWNRISYRFANIDIEVKPMKICIGKTETHEVCIEDSIIHMYPFYDLELSYQYPEFIIDTMDSKCYEVVDSDTRFVVGCEDPLHFILNLEKKKLAEKIKQLRMLKMLLENFLENIEFVFVFNSAPNP